MKVVTARATFTAFVLTCMTVFSGPVAAQDASGVWNCEWGAQNTAPGVPAEAVTQKFQANLFPDGTANGQGVMMGSGGNFPLTFTGLWGANGVQLQILMRVTGGASQSTYTEEFVSNFTSWTTTSLTDESVRGFVYVSRCLKVQ